DHTAPDVTATGTTLTLGCNPSADEINAALGSGTATDLCDGALDVTVTNSDITADGCMRSQTRTFSATDACGNSASTSRTVTWKFDHTAPVFDNVPADASYDCGVTIPDAPVVTATDNCEGTLTAKFESQSDLIAGDCGVYYFFRNWSVTDECGNSATAQQKITITPTDPIFTPESLPGDETTECGSGTPSTTAPAATACTPAGPIAADVTGPVRSENEIVDACTYKYTET
ncbi:MAG: hypothetical protein ACM3H8_02780, partial [Sphingobacteriales bacterium]